MTDNPFTRSRSIEADLYVPSESACAAFGIQRGGAKKIAPNLSFLKGPQFSGKDVNVTNPEKQEYNRVIDEVILEFIGNKPVAIIPKQGDDGIVKMEIRQKEIEQDLYTIRIAPSTTDWLKFGFSHEWNEGDGIMSRIMDTISGLIDSASGILNTAQNATGSNEARKKITLDKQDTYAKTDKVVLKIPFILFSAGSSPNSNLNPIEQWVEDVYAPLLTITAWSHPRRALSVTGEKEGKPVTKDASQIQSELMNSQASSDSGDDGMQAKAIQFLSSYPGMRVAISEPPSYVRVTHSSGFFQYNVCAITNFSYSFEGPWVKAYSLLPPGKKITEQEKQLLDVTIPMIAKCEIEIKVIEKMYADDWISMFENSPLINGRGGISSGIVNVMKGGGNPDKIKKREIAEKKRIENEKAATNT
jgi:hypothetical protein